MRNTLTDEQVESEIERLLNNSDVKLAKKEQQLKYRRRQYLYGLRQLEKRGKELRKSGITAEMLETMYSNDSEVDNGDC
jgi:hypothetical protein